VKRLIEKFVTGLTRLAFWRKPVPAVEESQENALPVLTELLTPASTADSAPESAIPDSALLESTPPDQSISNTINTELLELSEHPVQPESVATSEPEPEAPAPTPTIVVATPDRTPAIQEPSESVVPADTAPEQSSLLTRLTNRFRRKANPDTEENAEPEQPKSGLPVGRKPDQAGLAVSAEVETEAAPGKLSLLTRLKKVFRRKADPVTEDDTETGQPKSGLPDGRRADQAGLAVSAEVETEAAPGKLSLLTRLKDVFHRKPSPAENDTETTAPDGAAPAEDGEVLDVGRFQRVRARLSSKWVWIPGLGVIVLAPLVVMAVMLMQSVQEKARLQAELQAAQKKLEQPSPLKQPDASHTAKKQTDDTLEPGENSLPETAGGGADSGLGVDAGDCVVTDQASVIKNLKNCIEGFNRTSAR
jgi:hypothetical protein